MLQAFLFRESSISRSSSTVLLKTSFSNEIIHLFQERGGSNSALHQRLHRRREQNPAASRRPEQAAGKSTKSANNHQRTRADANQTQLKRRLVVADHFADCPGHYRGDYPDFVLHLQPMSILHPAKAPKSAKRRVRGETHYQRSKST